MKTRFLIYVSLLLGALSLPIIYQSMNNKLQEREYSIREQKEEWLLNTAAIEFDIASLYPVGSPLFLYYYSKSLSCIDTDLKMLAEDLDNVIKSLG